jgi:hypothetical protein
MTDQSVIVKAIDCEGDFTWPLPQAIDPDQLAARFPNSELFVAASEGGSDERSSVPRMTYPSALGGERPSCL